MDGTGCVAVDSPPWRPPQLGAGRPGVDPWAGEAAGVAMAWVDLIIDDWATARFGLARQGRSASPGSRRGQAALPGPSIDLAVVQLGNGEVDPRPWRGHSASPRSTGSAAMARPSGLTGVSRYMSN
ncbi:hypothetical protein NL676_034411 [Syzygium grande]|nr:hypothetical protein NL676_034411 [Syzygium grande]